MRPLLRQLVLISVVLAAGLLMGCGNEIGDSCSISRDCSTKGERICDQASPNGYCTILGCDFDTCPDEAECIRFFTSSTTNLSCTTDIACAPDELCTLGGFCVPRSSEVRYCMKTCGGSGDCRDDYECRDDVLMKQHGGEPVAEPGKPLGDKLQAFCAPAPLAL